MRVLLIVLYMFIHFGTSAQNLKTQILRDWYASVRTDKLTLFDSIRMYPERPLNNEQNIITWQYIKKNQFRLWLINNSTDAIHDPYISSIIKWKIRERKGITIVTIKWSHIKHLYRFNLHYNSLGSIDNMDIVSVTKGFNNYL